MLIQRLSALIRNPRCSQLLSGSFVVENRAHVHHGKVVPLDDKERDPYAYNHIEKKKGLMKPKHTIEEQIAYMKSEVFADTYQGLPIYKWYRRNLAIQPILQPPPRLFCIDKNGYFNLNHACPVCRDEYLFFDYRNPALIEQFLTPGTDQPIELLKTGLCRDQYSQLRAQLLKAREHGLIEFSVEYRVFDYSQWYDSWTPDMIGNVEDEGIPITRRSTPLESLFPSEPVTFEAHRPDFGNSWNTYWEKDDKFAKKGR
ncbi:hypothetical protein M3Y94_00781300 [Aphelenchoides besseyi]|nr:hypothetical protein M3Y94_00781300 [Aphelenchoides besseyi]KAI6232355.1 hypothetical protein M3Y95_00477300 [Aphelenchoides besseyi]